MHAWQSQCFIPPTQMNVLYNNIPKQEYHNIVTVFFFIPSLPKPASLNSQELL
jgi:hypothetical protein